MSSNTGEDLAGNMPEFTVSELSFALKRTVEEAYGYVRVRGEIGRVSKPASGHIYLDLKDEKSVLNGVIWRGVATRLKVAPEQGLEVICTGKLTTFPGQSRYQIVIERMEPAGIGALMALLEERRKKLAAEGLFDEAHKKPLPFLPQVIGVVTSPSGAVIRDILHRLEDRFPRHVLIWPSLVQGDKAAREIAQGIIGFNHLHESGPVPRPDVLIVARGGGSIEDLWPFNEEIVVRAVAESAIPVISAVGHETDTTLIDFVSDRRAPTPSAAAEMVVPVRADLRTTVLDLHTRFTRSQTRLLQEWSKHTQSLARGLPKLDDILGLPGQRLDAVTERLRGSLQLYVQARGTDLARRARLTPRPLLTRIAQGSDRLAVLGDRLKLSLSRDFSARQDRLTARFQLLKSYSYTGVLERGFVLVQRSAGQYLRRAEESEPGEEVTLQFADGRRAAVLGASKGPILQKAALPRHKSPKKPNTQGDLF